MATLQINIGLGNLTADALASGDFSTADLMAFQERIDKVRADFNDLIQPDQDKITEAIEKRYSPALKELRATKPKGKVSIEEDGVEISTTVSPKVDWDTAKTNEVLKANPNDVKALAPKVVVTIPEKNFTSARDDLRKALTACRTVKETESKISFKRKEAKT